MSGVDEKYVAERDDVPVKEVKEMWHYIREQCRNDKKHRDDPEDFARTTDWKKPM